MGSTVLVTGATGKTGRRLIPRLLARGVRVRAASRTPESPVDAGVEPVRFDWFDERTYPDALRGVDAVYLVSTHLAPNVIDPSEQVEVFLAAAGAAVRQVVLLSSYGVDQAPDEDPLRRTELRVSHRPSTILRPAAFMENFSEEHWSGLRAGIAERGVIAMPGGAGRVSYVSADDIAAVAATVLTEDGHLGRAYTLTGPEALTLDEVAKHISAATGRRVDYVDTGPESVRHSLLAAGASPPFADYVTRLYVGAVTTDAMSAVTTDIASVTGRPATAFADYAVAAAGAWRSDHPVAAED